MRRTRLRPLAILFMLPLLLTSCRKNEQLSETYEQLPSPISVSANITPENAAQIAKDANVVVIDPGHGFSDGGTTPPKSFGLDITESSVVMKIGQKVNDILKQKGIAALLTRTSDYDERQKNSMVNLSLADRVDMANKIDAAMFVSIHVDAYEESGSPNGYAVYYYDKQDELSTKSADLAAKLSESFSAATGVGEVKIWARKKGESFYVNRKTNMPSALFEVGFITNESDARHLADDEWLNKAAQGIADGIQNYLNKISGVTSTTMDAAGTADTANTKDPS